MVVHPPPPADAPALIEAYRQTLDSFISTCDGLRADDWGLDTACPGWRIRDHLAHIVHLEDHLSRQGAEEPADEGGHDSDETAGIAPGRPAHVRHEFGAWLEQGVRRLADRDPVELVAELRGLADLRTAQVYGPDVDLETPLPGIRGAVTPLGRLLQLRMLDIWVHEQDIREAVGRPGALDAPGASQFTEYVLDHLPELAAEHLDPTLTGEAGAPVTVILESTGPVTGRAGVRLGTDADGGRTVHTLFTGHSESEESDEGTTTMIALSTHELARRAAGRRSTDDTAYQVTGDEELARVLLDALVVVP